jgi:hypothetical protein
MFVVHAKCYCLKALKETKTPPILVVFNVDGVSEKEFFEKPSWRARPIVYSVLSPMG